MASMAAAIAAARISVSGNRPLDEKERNRFAYFSSLNSMAKKIMQDKERVRERYGAQWDKMPPKEQDEAIDKSLVDPELQKRYALHRGPSPDQPVPCYPVLKIQSGQKVVHFGEEDITWQDEHSAPFSWETKGHLHPAPCNSICAGRQRTEDKDSGGSQMEFSISSLSTQEPTSTIVQSEQKQTPKSSSQSNQIKTPLGNSAAKPPQGMRTPNCDGTTPVRKEEESAFWKISMERSRVDGSQVEFQSLTPSQIKSLEKGEKPLPVYCRQDSFQKEKEVTKLEKPEKSLLSEKPSVVTKQPKTTNPSSISLALESPRPSQSSVSTLDDVFLPEPPAVMQSVTKTSKEPEHDEAVTTGPQLFSQINTSSVLLKTGFDFLDNW
ncbi:uncharacterized protein C1orf198 homolog isoform X1 [Hyla sarda]|uniref:uncharacterized protein C1orf198 homolog isoform X1 n=1 Tax=Hyla sarda TaxID=327740 RepID=UPI0024C212FE|nr:uncharacterized protein C1orf198 homolog isoform X1 [Hyla sarda]